MAKWAIGVWIELVVIGHDPEWADYSNPTGAIEGRVACLVAENRRGRRFLGPNLGRVNSEEVPDWMDAKAKEIEAGLPPDWTPPEGEWYETYPVYGSRAYQDQEADLVEEEIAEHMGW